MQTINDSDLLQGIYAVVDWLYFHMWKKLYAILIRAVEAFLTCEKKAYRFAQISFTK